MILLSILVCFQLDARLQKHRIASALVFSTNDLDSELLHFFAHVRIFANILFIPVQNKREILDYCVVAHHHQINKKLVTCTEEKAFF